MLKTNFPLYRMIQGRLAFSAPLLRWGAPLPFRDTHDRLLVVSSAYYVALPRAAPNASVHDPIRSPFKLDCFRLHKTETCICPIAGIIVNVLAPETDGTMVRKSIPLYRSAALFADKVFFRAPKFIRQGCCVQYLRPYPILVYPNVSSFGWISAYCFPQTIPPAMKSSWVTSMRQKSGGRNSLFSCMELNSTSTVTRPARPSWNTSISNVVPLLL